MPKRIKTRFICPVAAQLPLFPDAASLIRVRPERNEWRFYRMEVWPDLFGRALLVRQWGRIGTEGRRRLDPHPEATRPQPGDRDSELPAAGLTPPGSEAGGVRGGLRVPGCRATSSAAWCR